MPHTISTVIRYREMIDGFMELPKDKRPPECLHPKTEIYLRINGIIRVVPISYIWEKRYDLSSLEILSPNGWVKIINVRKQTHDKLFRVDVGKTIESILCSENHMFVSISRRCKNYSLQQASSLKCAKNTNYQQGYLLHKTLENLLIPSIFEIDGYRLNYNLGYLIGVYAAEGGFWFHTFRYTMSSTERETLEKIAKTASELNSKKVRILRHKSDKQSILRLKFSNKKLLKLVTEIVPGNIYTKKFDLDILLNTPLEFRVGIYEGYIDGDGHVKPDLVTLVSSASKSLIRSFMILALSIGKQYSESKKVQYDPRYDKYNTSYTALSRFGGLQRRHFNRDGFSHFPVNLVSSEEMEVELIDIEVEGGLFIIGNGIVSHNSIWFDGEKLEDWFDDVFKTDSHTISFDVNEVEG